LDASNGILRISGNLVLHDDAKFTVTKGTLSFEQTTYSEYYMSLDGRSELAMTDSWLATNATTENNFSMSLDAYDDSKVVFWRSRLNTKTGSWLLGNFHDRSKLDASGMENLPTEIYPYDSTTISTAYSLFGSVWLDLAAGDKGTLNIPRLDAYKRFNLAFTPSQGHTYAVDMTSTNCRIGVNSHPSSTLTINGNGLPPAYSANIVIGYYIENASAPVVVDQLTVGTYITKSYTHQGRSLALNKVYLNPFAWQVYVEQTNGHTVTIKNSKINELAALTNGLVAISNSTLQLAVTGAVGPGSKIDIDSTKVWSQSLLAQNGGKINIKNSEIHGNYMSASGVGSDIVMTNVTEYRNAVSPQSCAPIGGYPPNNYGVPTCNPFNPLYQCSKLKTSNGGTISNAAACTP
jgi:hypothetical protein